MNTDMLVKLYEVQDDPALEERLRREGILLKRAMTPDLTRITDFVRDHFSQGWADQCAAGILTGGCWIATQNRQIVGFACFDATMKNFFGPTGVLETMRGKGVGKALLLKCMLSMRERGYAYAVIGWAGPVDFYRKTVGAIPIEGSIPRSYGNRIDVE